MCADLEATLVEFKRKGVAVKIPTLEQEWGSLASIVLPGGSAISIYQPKHPNPASPLNLCPRGLFEIAGPG